MLGFNLCKGTANKRKNKNNLLFFNIAQKHIDKNMSE